MTKEQLIEIRKKTDEAKLLVECLGMQNAYDLSVEQRIDSAANYKIQHDIWMKYEEKYNKAFAEYMRENNEM